MTAIIDGTAGITTPAITSTTTPVVTTPQSSIKVNTANGYGSTNTRIRRFSNVQTSQGTDITYADSATLGASFTINTSGVYSISYTDSFNVTDAAVITLNDSAPTTSPVITDSLASGQCPAAAQLANAAWTGYLTQGSIIRARSYNGNVTGTLNFGLFTITRVS
jgi:hypothetical protein